MKNNTGGIEELKAHIKAAPSNNERGQLLIKASECFMSRNASDMFKIAVLIAHFDAESIWEEIKKLQGPRLGRVKINLTTVDNAIDRANPWSKKRTNAAH